MVLGSLTFENDMVHNGLHSAAQADVVYWLRAPSRLLSGGLPRRTSGNLTTTVSVAAPTGPPTIAASKRDSVGKLPGICRGELPEVAATVSGDLKAFAFFAGLLDVPRFEKPIHRFSDRLDITRPWPHLLVLPNLRTRHQRSRFGENFEDRYFNGRQPLRLCPVRVSLRLTTSVMICIDAPVENGGESYPRHRRVQDGGQRRQAGIVVAESRRNPRSLLDVAPAAFLSVLEWRTESAPPSAHDHFREHVALDVSHRKHCVDVGMEAEDRRSFATIKELKLLCAWVGGHCGPLISGQPGPCQRRDPSNADASAARSPGATRLPKRIVWKHRGDAES